MMRRVITIWRTSPGEDEAAPTGGFLHYRGLTPRATHAIHNPTKHNALEGETMTQMEAYKLYAEAADRGDEDEEQYWWDVYYYWDMDDQY